MPQIILDCDPGIDDALAIAFAAGHQGIEFAGITTVAGNVALELTTRNALAVASFVGAGTVPVTAGAAGPLLRPASDARIVHGDSGLGAAVLPEPSVAARPGSAADFIIRTARSSPGTFTLVATGPLTNIALALRLEPRLPELVSQFVIMGGSAARGNVTPVAEFNIWADPEAAAVVFSAGWTVHMIGLDVTLQALATPPVQERMKAMGSLGSTLLVPALAMYGSSIEGRDYPAVHDVCALAYLAEPSLFGMRPALVQVETQGRWTAGATVTDFGASQPNASVAMEIDTGRFWELVLAAYAEVAARRP